MVFGVVQKIRLDKIQVFLHGNLQKILQENGRKGEQKAEEFL